MPRSDYQASLARDNAAAALRSRTDRDIGAKWPGSGDLVRRAACELDLRRYLETYHAAAFPLAWSRDHLKVIREMERAILEGGLAAVGMPRGSGKTTLTVRAALWAILYAHRLFLSLIGATERAGRGLLKPIKTELLYNELLIADFPAVCYPLIRLEGHARKAAGQLCDGHATRIEWGEDRLVLPTVPAERLDGPDVGGSTITVAGLTGALRGQSTTLATGRIIRPELVLLDDPQTRESALSASQSANRLEIVNGDVLGMAGPQCKITAIACVTVIRSGDMAEVLLDRDRSPRWHGHKCRLMDALPTNTELWDAYAKIRASSLRAGGDGAEATEFYRRNREAMDLGAEPTWPERHLDDEISATQHAMNLKIDDEPSFLAEYQNDPVRVDGGDGTMLTAEAIAGKTSGVRRGELPIAVELLTASIDVHDSVLFWSVVGWSTTFEGWVSDYGTYPDQRVRYFTLRKAPRTLANTFKGAGKEGAIRAGLEALTAELVSREWRREDGSILRINRCLIDAGYVPDVVYDVCLHSTHAAILLPSRGVGIGASSRPIAEYDRTKGDRIGHFWYIPKATDRRAQRHLRFDSNYWKSFIHARFATPLGDSGALSLFGHDADEHRLIADHLTAEIPIRTSGQGRSLDEWRTRPDRTDNHYLDTIAGNAAAASLSGAALAGATSAALSKPRRRVSFAELQRQAQARKTKP